jgi:hypothetical protein
MIKVFVNKYPCNPFLKFSLSYVVYNMSPKVAYLKQWIFPHEQQNVYRKQVYVYVIDLIK